MTTSTAAQQLANNNNNNNSNNNHDRTTPTSNSTTALQQQQQQTTTTHCIGIELNTTTPTVGSASHHSPQPATVNQHHHSLNETTTTTTTTTTTNSASGGVGGANRVMQADEDFNIRFVNLVRTHKCLYDKKVPEYRNRDNQEKAWVLISQETRESVIHCKERWRNLRACLSRYIKQQSGSEPQHKPYYLTEHMAFLLPFLKSTRNSLEGNSNLATLYQLSQQHEHSALHLLSNASQMQHQLHNGVELKQSLSENDDEETIDAFDPAVAASLGLQQRNGLAGGRNSPALSDTASANTLQNFIPDVQLAESAQDIVYVAPNHNHHHQHQHQHATTHMPPHLRRDSRDYDACSTSGGGKRIKTECEPSTSGQYWGGSGASTGGCENSDMEFFRSILPDIAVLTPQQRRKFKIGILELIDDVVERFPANGGERVNGHVNGTSGVAGSGGTRGQGHRRNPARDAWRNNN